jgi:hypothetical protein
MPDEEPIVATDGVLLLHVPPEVASDNVMVVPAHNEVGPVIVPADAAGLTVTVVETVQVPIAYVTTAVPTVTPVTTPDEEPTVTLAEPVAHVPPATVLDKVIVLPWQTTGEAGVIAAGDVLTVITLIAKQPVGIV